MGGMEGCLRCLGAMGLGISKANGMDSSSGTGREAMEEGEEDGKATMDEEEAVVDDISTRAKHEASVVEDIFSLRREIQHKSYCTGTSPNSREAMLYYI